MKFRKKPVIVEAMQYDGTTQGGARVVDWMWSFPGPRWGASNGPNTGLRIKTLENPNANEWEWAVASKGDWIIRGVEGEFYPCKETVFASTYEAA